ncbi:hypothetical protein QNH23_16385 [Siminovitchia fortis]|uniref:Uncharacterized protein n=1 Tax=Siminovitchia fortis TaxID=254758 RepID=A0A443IX19_9BACI|nr:hypothetical protein [Siminovitchia fortis]RWR12622.1 hypothetical protein D4N35_006270 [Siminovitchia fortis]WHY81431.1 hypothetical protein QNH23_16385 [Siminovitchia fortis]
MIKKTATLFSLACITFFITGPFASWMIYKKAQSPGTFSNQVIKPGETFSQMKAGKTLEVWGAPASLDIQGVQCKSGDELIELEKERTAIDIKGKEAVLLFDGDYTVFDRISCEGGGLEEIYLSNRFPMDKARKIIISLLVTTPLVGGFGIFLFRRTRSS